ncbi:FAD-dependent monooxygenase [Mycolicibacterium monacense]|uniref:2-polyprenyl-6-methoxyphenol hydroxylase n=4 Tax=Mycobacteriaceae TaxID=1762 RepID=A0AAD1J0J6_MYCMB|nr:FAD-dependent monooxygenase [Mycolicibacterium monacense]MDA4103388.1 FAD-binding monooxygenase [Mycolicibacterium monacense DSM 44395]OBB58917.1 FAD-binding monooxygenase [Mycolicibacterium monacense]OBF56506.1 FAD-binding monooxygenase [Mycolicibacterium monacense]ORB21094.1 FAD-binding monooxygenase [Mycolicibacterium monacense DSM 44395]QHP88977.1 FAD-binding protein [Mycolicibacterium monacense DSM 44395]
MSPAYRVDDLPVTDTDVLIVGAGPTGLMAALALHRRGVPAVLVDRKAGPTRESRALAVQARTMEVYDQLGLADTVLANSNSALRIQVGGSSRGIGPNLAKLQDGHTRFPGVHIFEQSRNEDMLAGALTAGGGDIRWRHRLVDLQDRTAAPDGRVEALLEGPDGTLLRVRARWCIGADGAASAVRRALNLPFEGRTDEATFWVADVRAVRGVPDDAVNIRPGKRTFAAVFPLGPGGHVRLLGLAAKDTITQDEALATVAAEFGLTHGPVEWFSTYRVHHRVSARFRVGSIFLAGDAAHVHSPVGGQGMNTGLQDAHNLAMLLADVAQNRVDGRALDRYERERRPVALTLVNVTDRAFTVIGRRGSSAGLVRATIGALAFGVFPLVTRTSLGTRLGGYIGQYRIRYRYTANQTERERDPAVGLRLPPVADNQRALDTMTWQLHAYGAGTIVRPDVPEWIDGPREFGADPRGRLRSDRLYLVRPDQFVAASIPLRDNVVDEAHLRAALATHQILHAGP